MAIGSASWRETQAGPENRHPVFQITAPQGKELP
jgi:hypothetical protein